MKKYLLFSLVVISLSFSIKSTAQTEWAPVGAVWHYSYPYAYVYNAETYIKIESIGDTLIDGISCRILLQECPRDLSLTRRYYTYKSDGIVWVYDGEAFRVLYDFTTQLQEEWEAYGPNIYGIHGMCEDSSTVLITENLGSEDLNGTSYQYIEVSIPDFQWRFSLCGPDVTKISEVFGSYGFMFPQEICIIDAAYPCNLRCYEDNVFGFYATEYMIDSCTYEYGVGVKEIELVENINVGPNPVSDVLNIDLKGDIKGSYFILFNVTGQALYKGICNSHNMKVNMMDFRKGTYILKVYHEGVFSAGKIIRL